MTLILQQQLLHTQWLVSCTEAAAVHTQILSAVLAKPQSYSQSTAIAGLQVCC